MSDWEVVLGALGLVFYAWYLLSRPSRRGAHWDQGKDAGRRPLDS